MNYSKLKEKGNQNELFTVSFAILILINNSSFGEVFSARRKSDGLVVAVKKIEVENNVVSNNLEREIDILRDCHHPNVVNYYTSFRHKHYMWVCFYFLL